MTLSSTVSAAMARVLAAGTRQRTTPTTPAVPAARTNPTDPHPEPGEGAPRAVREDLCGACDIPQADHGVRYAHEVGHHTWMRTIRRVP